MMEQRSTAIITDLLETDEQALLQGWVDQQVASGTMRSVPANRTELTDHSRRFLTMLRDGLARGDDNIHSAAWKPVREMLDELSATRLQQGYSPSETAWFVLSLKQVMFERLHVRHAANPAPLAAAVAGFNAILDRLALYTTDVYQRGREQVIVRQQQEMLELSTPVVTLWEGVLALPLIGTLDSGRTQVVMESLLQRIVDTGAAIAIIDITGVPTVDTLTAQHLLKTVSAARLMGADCIISGIRPQIAQTIVHLGVDLGNVVTKATLADAFSIALRRLGLAVTKAAPARRQPGAGGSAPDGEASGAPERNREA